MDLQSIKNILKFTSAVGIGLSIFFVMASITGALYNEDITNLIIFNILFFVGNFFIYAILRKHEFKMSIKEGILAVNVVWILLGVGGAITLYLTSNIPFVDAFFEAVSGFTTTGATIYSDIESLSHTTLILRSLMHWIGGMGIIVLSVGLLTLINPTGSLTLFKAESTGVTVEKLTPKIKDTALRLWGVYLFLTIFDAILLKVGGMSFFDAINHAFSTISTGGFSTKNASLGYWGDNSFIIWVTTIFMFLTGVNFLAHLKLANGNFDGYKSEEFRWYLVIFLLLSISLTVAHISTSGDTFLHSLTHSFFTISSLLTTTGFASLDYEQWGAVAIAIIFISMLIGGNAGSTAGGVKVIRVVILFKNLFLQVKKILHPNAILSIYIDKEKISGYMLGSVMGFFLLYSLTNVFLTLYLFANGYDLLTSLSAALATIGNIGPGFAQVGPAHNFALFTPVQKIVLSFFMIIGRLEFYTFVLLFSRDFWKKF